ncbi:MAG: ABC transporter permease, partial [Alphaproteobacteria bacterium]|nr:ABC transporter permease [Alphaproteobacteria bacterium]
MFNFIASSVMVWLLVEVLIAPGQQSPESRPFSPASVLPAMHTLFGAIGVKIGNSPLNLSLVVALLAALGFHIFIWHTRWGYEVRAVGHNETAAVYAGIPVKRTIVLAMALSGALAGLMPLNEVLGVQHRLLVNFTGGAGFVGIAVALMGRNHAVGIVLAAILFGALTQGGSELAFEKPAISRDMIVVIQGLIILFSGALENLFRAPLARLLRTA